MKKLSILALTLVAAAISAGCAFNGASEPTPVGITLTKIGGFGSGALGASEITAYDSKTKRLFVVNGTNGSLDVMDLRNPASPVAIKTIATDTLGGGVFNSVATFDGLIAVALEADPKTSPGKVVFYDAQTLSQLSAVNVSAQPDMLTFSPDGKYVVTANEGEPNSYNNAPIPPSKTPSVSIDPEGSVSVITVNGGRNPSVATADFKAYIGQETSLRAQGIRIFGPGANAAQDLEPEYVAVAPDSKTAFVTLQENNAIAIVDLASAKVTSIKSLGTKDHSLPGMGLDASDKDGGVNTNSGTPAKKIANYPVKGMYQPDGIAAYEVGGQTYFITANEGEARADWPGYTDETRVRQHCANGLDPAVFSDATNLILDSNLGRLRITATPFGGGTTGKNAAGQCNELYSFGARSFTIWNKDVVRVFDSGDQFEQRTLSLDIFNSSHETNSMDARSATKGPEPEGVTVGKIGAKHFAFIGLERIGGVMVYDVTTPTAPSFVTYFNNRGTAAGAAPTGDRGPEGVHFIPAAKSPNGKPLLILGNETSGTTSILQLNLSY